MIVWKGTKIETPSQKDHFSEFLRDCQTLTAQHLTEKIHDQIIMKPVDMLMHQAISDNVFPGGVLLISKESSLVFQNAYGVADLFSKRPMTEDTIFDLASLTKPLATTLAVMVLIQAKRVALEQTIGETLPAFQEGEKSAVKIKHLLYHNSGLPDYRAYYKDVEHLPRKQRKTALRNLLVNEPLIHPIGATVVYSDLGFMILEWMVEHICGKRLDRFVSEMIYSPLGLDTLFFVDLDATSREGAFAATELCPWRKIILTGQVHDENAYVVGGIQGHAGLFGTADSVHTLLLALLSAYHGDNSNNPFDKALVRLFFRRLPDTDKALGFDAPTMKNSSCGRYFSKNSVGHLGFTGTSFWMDLDRSIIVILLTNRVHPSRKNEAIKAFRPELHNAVLKCLLGKDC